MVRAASAIRIAVAIFSRAPESVIPSCMSVLPVARNSSAWNRHSRRSASRAQTASMVASGFELGDSVAQQLSQELRHTSDLLPR